ncbi:SDR family oxidoreductase [Methylomonas sp. UP202]|uniref:SDR family oxidoreductase n=1 Tax=Methylomonas sp. UP202 TaxID=3040943 RepID=UPI0024786854|nr:SDR family oxidoreductase [Methylomonas sp. UP202]WGS87162.1 SDR family oxidoreductase [Methylomonas sp. UP202]
MKSNYFVTGATGAIGSMLVPLLLEEPQNRIWLLIRANSPEHLRQRLEELIEFWELDTTRADDARRRITLLQGDTDEPRFALSEQAYGEIVKSCTHIIHSAGVVRMNLPLDTARKHALNAVKNIVELAHACQVAGVLQKVEYVSTIGVAGKMPGLIPETWITETRAFHNTYEQSKAEAEDYLREKMLELSLPVTVHRPSMVVGHSETGKIIHFQIFYYICDFLSGRLTFGLLPHLGNAKLDIIPVDYVAKCIKTSSQRPDVFGKIFHLCSGVDYSIELAEIRKAVRVAIKICELRSPILVDIPFLIFNSLIQIANHLATDNIRKTTKSFPFFLAYLHDTSGFENQLSARSLGIDLPLARDYLNLIITRYFIHRKGRLREASN